MPCTGKLAPFNVLSQLLCPVMTNRVNRIQELGLFKLKMWRKFQIEKGGCLPLDLESWFCVFVLENGDPNSTLKTSFIGQYLGGYCYFLGCFYWVWLESSAHKL